jgi:Tol biopolymer transport system component
MKPVSSLWRRPMVSLLLFAVGFMTTALSYSSALARNNKSLYSAANYFVAPPPLLPVQSSSKIVFTNSKNIFVANPDGTGALQLTFDGDNFTPSISKDGSKVVFARVIPGREDSDLYVVSSTGGVLQRIVSTPLDEFEPTWSPAGDQIAFVRGDEITFLHELCPLGCGNTTIADIYVKKANGAEQRLTHNGINVDPSWSSSGNLIAFSSLRYGDADLEIYTMSSQNGESGGLTKITNNDRSDAEPAWSPNDARIAYTSDYIGSINVNQLLPGKIPISNLVGKIPISNLVANKPTLEVMTLRTGQIIATSTGHNCEPTWSPDGNKLFATKIVEGFPKLRQFDANTLATLPIEIWRTGGVWSASWSGFTQH